MVQNTHIYTVTEFIRALDIQLSGNTYVLRGEVSSFKVSKNKWIFFDLKDQTSKVSCFCVVSQMRGMALEDGMEIRALGSPGVYAPQGKLTFRVKAVELVGEGELQRVYENIKAKLFAEGIFDESRKKPIPFLPHIIGLITSEDAAAYSDFLKILNNRWGGALVLFAPCGVQGVGAEAEIISAISYFNENPANRVEVIILTRGGGSMEDLQAFNSEALARAIFSSRIPVVVGVGHERDVTLADLAADKRASTPSHAAELLFPERGEFLERVYNEVGAMSGEIARMICVQREEARGACDGLCTAVAQKIARCQSFIAPLMLRYASFQIRLESERKSLHSLQNMLDSKVVQLFSKYAFQIARMEGELAHLNPQAVLKRGYSVSVEVATGRIVRNARTLSRGSLLRTLFARGAAVSEVKHVS